MAESYEELTTRVNTLQNALMRVISLLEYLVHEKDLDDEEDEEDDPAYDNVEVDMEALFQRELDEWKSVLDMLPNGINPKEGPDGNPSE